MFNNWLKRFIPGTNVRPRIENFLLTATPEQRIAVDEFIAVLAGDGDSGSIHTVLETCLKMADMEYILRCLETIKFIRESEANGTMEEVCPQ